LRIWARPPNRPGRRYRPLDPVSDLWGLLQLSPRPLAWRVERDRATERHLAAHLLDPAALRSRSPALFIVVGQIEPAETGITTPCDTAMLAVHEKARSGNGLRCHLTVIDRSYNDDMRRVGIPTAPARTARPTSPTLRRASTRTQETPTENTGRAGALQPWETVRPHGLWA
jgi:hypothetical protein